LPTPKARAQGEPVQAGAKRRGSELQSSGVSRLYPLNMSDELIESRSPTVVKAHLLMPLSSCLIPMNGYRGVPGPLPFRLQRYDRCQKWIFRWAVPRKKCIGPDEPLVRNDFQVAANIRKLLPVRRPHYRPENSPGAQIYLAFRNGPGRRREPFAEVFGLRPGYPNQVRRHVDYSFKNEVEPGIRFP
jgi:hypothetical protein